VSQGKREKIKSKEKKGKECFIFSKTFYENREKHEKKKKKKE